MAFLKSENVLSPGGSLLADSEGVQLNTLSILFDGWVGGTEYQKCPSNFFILCEYIGNVYTYI